MAKGALIWIAALLLSACATSQQVQHVESMDFGSPPPDSVWQASVKNYFDSVLKDPDSAQYRMGCPVQGYIKNAVFAGRPGMEFVGHLARVEVNARNSFGGYTGYKNYIVPLGRNGEVYYVIESLSRGAWDHPRLHLVNVRDCEEPRRVRFDAEPTAAATVEPIFPPPAPAPLPPAPTK